MSFSVALLITMVVARCVAVPWVPPDRSNLYRTMDALERTAEFMVRHKEVMTLDHALGAAIAAGQVDGVLGTASRRVAAAEAQPEEHAGLARRLGEIRTDLFAVCRAVLEDVKGRADSQGSEIVERLLQPSLWRRPAPLDVPPQALRTPTGIDGQLAERTILELRELAGMGPLAEERSGRCIAAVLGSSPCRVPRDCEDANGAESGYTATHQLLFYHLADQAGCCSPSQRLAFVWKIAGLCDGILGEAEAIARAGFPPLLRDLFAEQVALCGLRAFPGFARRDWLDELLRWQQPSGCFGDFGELQDAARPFRALRNNARLDDRLGLKCVSHLTGVAVAALAFNLRALAEGGMAGGTP